MGTLRFIIAKYNANIRGYIDYCILRKERVNFASKLEQNRL